MFSFLLTVLSCKVPSIVETKSNIVVPQFYNKNTDTVNSAKLPYHIFFKDKNLTDLIDTAVKNNQELMITLQEIEIAKNEIRLRKSALLPIGGIKLQTGLDKVGRYTSQGAGDASTEITPNVDVPENLTDFSAFAYANWEIDIWKKLRNSKKAAVSRYLSTIEGKNFVITNLVAEIAKSYYELIALDNELDIVKQNIEIQKNALEIVKVQKQAARTTELAVKKFEAEVYYSQSMEFEITQKINETENRINFLLGRFPQEVKRSKTNLLDEAPQVINSGIPSQLLLNRPDVKKAELELIASKLDVKVARAEFFPSFGINAAFGFQAFKPKYLLEFPESLLYSIAGDLVTPLINRNAIKAEFNNANARQIQALYNYEKTVLEAYIEVSTQLSKIDNLSKGYDLKSKQVDALNSSIDIANQLFKSARADYFEVLMTQRDALENKIELVETKKEQMNAVVDIYRNLGGGWN